MNSDAPSPTNARRSLRLRFSLLSSSWKSGTRWTRRKSSSTSWYENSFQRITWDSLIRIYWRAPSTRMTKVRGTISSRAAQDPRALSKKIWKIHLCRGRPLNTDTYKENRERFSPLIWHRWSRVSVSGTNYLPVNLDSSNKLERL